MLTALLRPIDLTKGGHLPYSRRIRTAVDRHIGALVLVLALGVTLIATLAACAGPAAAAVWQRQAHIPGEGIRPNLPILGISCPSSRLCVAVGELDYVISSTNPTGGASAWHSVQPTGAAETDCRAGAIPSCWPPERRRLRGVSCPSPRLCVAVTGEGYVYSTTDPTGPANAWNVADIDGTGRDTHLLAVSCPTVSLCVAVSGERETAGKILTSTNPTGGASAWNETQLDESLDLRGVSCGTPTLCVAVARHGRVLTSTNPAGGESAWTEIGTPGGPGDLQGISCATTVLCVAGNSGGNLLTSTNPFAVSGWREQDAGSSVQITGVSCLTTHQCLAVDNNGNGFASDDPTAEGGSWSMTKVIPYVQPPDEYHYPLNALFDVDCTSSSFCAAVGADGQIFTSTDPFDDPPRKPRGSDSGRKRKHGPKRPVVKIAAVRLPNYRALREHRARITVRFFANGPVRRFECRLDGAHFHTCRSPTHFRVDSSGTWEIRIRAVGRTGLRGPVTARRFCSGRRCNKHGCYSPGGRNFCRPAGGAR